jgi:2,4-dienoyl-CoA reductase-like NADH-dependent reductase (Old Yellow Enzyme family)
MTTRSPQVLFSPHQILGVRLPNRIVMAPMTRSCSPGGVPGEDVAAYYRRRAEGGVGLIVTEGTYPPHAAAGFDPKVPHMYGDAALAGWRQVVDGVHAAGGRVFSQLWHLGMRAIGAPGPLEGVHPVGTSMPLADIRAVIDAYGAAAANAQSVGFDGVEIHAAHGYLIDQFFWEETNRRTDQYGGSLVARTRFGADVVTEIRARVGKAFPVALRFSQFKIEDYDARLANTAAELERFLAPLADAGVDVFHASARRFWDAAFTGSSLTLAGWTKKLTGRSTIAVGSVSLGTDMMTSFGTDDPSGMNGIDSLLDCMERGEFDLIAIGRALITNPEWPRIVQSGHPDRLQPFRRAALATLA